MINNKDRVLFVPHLVAFGGGERVYLALSRFLHERGIPHRIATYTQGINLQDHADWPLTVQTVKPEGSFLPRPNGLRRLVSEQARAGSPPPILVGIQAATHLSATLGGQRNRSVPYSVMVLDAPSKMGITSAKSRGGPRRFARNMLNRFFGRAGLNHANNLSIISETQAREMQTLYGRKPQVIYPGIRLPTETRDRRHFRGVFRFLSVCRLEGNKRLEWIMESLARLEHTGGNKARLSDLVPWHLDIVGHGSLAGKLERLCDSLGIRAFTTFHGLVSDDRLDEIYAQAGMFLMPANQGYGLPALEALARRVPVVMHQESGVSEILRNSPWVGMIYGSDTSSLTVGIEEMVGHVLAGALEGVAPPEFPTDEEWAARVCAFCDWL